MPFLQRLRTFLGPSCPYFFLEFAENYHSCYFCDIYYYVFLASKKNPCYFCDFFHIFGLFGAFLGLFSFLVFNLVTFVILAIFANSHYSLPGVFDWQEKSLLLLFLRHLRTFRRPSWPFLFLSVEFCYIFYSCDYCDTCYLVFLTSKKTPCYFCDFCDIC